MRYYARAVEINCVIDIVKLYHVYVAYRHRLTPQVTIWNLGDVGVG